MVLSKRHFRNRCYQLDHTTNWAVGDEIVIASTDFYHEHAEKVTITAITGGN